MPQRLRLAYVSLGGMIAWFIHLMVIYLLGEFLCVAQGTWSILGFSAAQWSVALVTVLLFLLSLGAALLAGRDQKWSRRRPDSGGNRGIYFLCRAGLISNVFFAFAILFEAVPILYLGQGC